MKTKRISTYALRSITAMQSESVERVNYKIIQQLEDILLNNKEAYYVGVKDTNVIPSFYLNKIEENGFLIHTYDKMSDRGRALDYELKNPITGRYMTGSSSGTAINVFKGFNDIGIGTDGGGSVLAPAIALNLYGFISPYICNDELSLYSKKSTDNIVFQPSIGFITKDLTTLNKIVDVSIDGKADLDLKLVLANPNNEYQTLIFEQLMKDLEVDEEISLSYDSSSRERLMEDLKSFDFDHKILMTFEGPVDLFEYGDSLMGHYGALYKHKQMQAHKYYLTVVNMLNLSAVIIPSSQLSAGVLMICKSEPNHIKSMLKKAELICFERSELEERYFSFLNY